MGQWQGAPKKSWYSLSTCMQNVLHFTVQWNIGGHYTRINCCNMCFFQPPTRIAAKPSDTC